MVGAMSGGDYKVVILCGGQGTRLKEETEFRPKPMVEVGGRPLLWHIMKLHAHQGFRDFVLALGFKGHVIREFFLNYRRQTSDLTIAYGHDDHEDAVTLHSPSDVAGWQITMADTGELTNTGGRIFRLRDYVKDSTFLMTYGDGVADIDLDGLLAHHRQSGRLATVTGLQAQSRFGVLEQDGEGGVARFREKPLLDSWISGGFFVLEPGVFDYLDDNCVFEQEPLRRLADEGQLSVYKHSGFWKSIDTYREYLDINRMWDQGERPWATWER